MTTRFFCGVYTLVVVVSANLWFLAAPVGAADAIVAAADADIDVRKLKIAQDAFESVVELQGHGQISAENTVVTVWLGRLIAAQQQVFKDANELSAALRKNVAMMKKHVADVEALNRAGSATKLAVLEAQFGLLSAEAALAQQERLGK